MMLWTCAPCEITMPADRFGKSGSRLACLNCNGGWLRPATREEHQVYDALERDRAVEALAAKEARLSDQFIAATLHALGEPCPTPGATKEPSNG